MFTREYLEKLFKYIDCKIPIIDKGNEAILNIDFETKYILSKDDEKYTLYIEERGTKRVRTIYDSEIDMQRKFSLLMKNTFGGSIDYKYVDKFGDVLEFSILKELMIKYSNKDYYSIDHDEADKINLVKKHKNIFNLYFLGNNMKKYMIVSERKAPFIFKRFYNKSIYLSVMSERIKEYENTFEEVLDYNTKIELLGYK